MHFTLSKGGEAETEVQVKGGSPGGSVQFTVLRNDGTPEVVFDITNQGVRKLVAELNRWAGEARDAP